MTLLSVTARSARSGHLGTPAHPTGDQPANRPLPSATFVRYTRHSWQIPVFMPSPKRVSLRTMVVNNLVLTAIAGEADDAFVATTG